MDRFGWQCYVFHLPGKGNGTCLHEQHKDPSSGIEHMSSEVLMATLKTAVSQEFVLTFIPRITWKGQCVWSEFYNKDINNFLLLSRKEAKQKSRNLCFGLVFTFDNYFLLDSATF